MIEINEEFLKCIIKNTNVETLKKVDKIAGEFKKIKCIDNSIIIYKNNSDIINMDNNFKKQIISIFGDFSGYEIFCNELTLESELLSYK